MIYGDQTINYGDYTINSDQTMNYGDLTIKYGEGLNQEWSDNDRC